MKTKTDEIRQTWPLGKGDTLNEVGASEVKERPIERGFYWVSMNGKWQRRTIEVPEVWPSGRYIYVPSPHPSQPALPPQRSDADILREAANALDDVGDYAPKLCDELRRMADERSEHETRRDTPDLVFG